MRAKKGFILGLSAAIVAILAISYSLPPIGDFNLENPFWNGLSQLNSMYNPTPLSDLTRLSSVVTDPSKASLLMIGPSKPFTIEEVLEVKKFLDRGGTLILADDFGTGNALLEKLNVESRFSGLLILDPLFKERAIILPKIRDFEPSRYTIGVKALTMNYATTIENLRGGVETLAKSSSFSYLRGDVGPPDDDSRLGPFPVMAEIRYGEGSLILLSDSSLFINSMINIDDNGVLLENLSKERILYIDLSHYLYSPFSNFKAILMRAYSLALITEVKYGLVALTALIALKLNSSRRNEHDMEDRLTEIMKRHPDWNLEILQKLKLWRDVHEKR